MRILPSSPRARRRLLWIGGPLGIAVAVVAAVALAPEGKAPSPGPSKNAPRAQSIRQSTYVSPADRRAIDRTLDRFIPAALGRSAPETAWNLAGPDLKSGSTLAQWRHGTSPVPFYPPRDTSFDSWKTVDAGPDYVDFDLLVHPQPGHGPKGSSEVFSGQMVKRDGRWLVNGLYTTAIFARPTKSGRHEVGPADFAAASAGQGGQGGAPQQTGHSARIGTGWLIAAGGAVVLALLFPLGFAVASAVRARRARRLYMRSDPRSLPPLPRSAQPSSEPPAGAGIGGPRH
jgi:hypothetical protein